MPNSIKRLECETVVISEDPQDSNKSEIRVQTVDGQELVFSGCFPLRFDHVEPNFGAQPQQSSEEE